MANTVFGYWCTCGKASLDGSLYCSSECRHAENNSDIRVRQTHVAIKTLPYPPVRGIALPSFGHGAAHPMAASAVENQHVGMFGVQFRRRRKSLPPQMLHPLPRPLLPSKPSNVPPSIAQPGDSPRSPPSTCFSPSPAAGPAQNPESCSEPSIGGKPSHLAASHGRTHPGAPEGSAGPECSSLDATLLDSLLAPSSLTSTTASSSPSLRAPSTGASSAGTRPPLSSSQASSTRVITIYKSPSLPYEFLPSPPGSPEKPLARVASTRKLRALLAASEREDAKGALGAGRDGRTLSKHRGHKKHLQIACS